MVVRIQHSIDALKNAKIRVLELISAGNRRLPGIIGVPRTEMPARLDFTRRQRVEKAGVVTKSVFTTDRIQRQFVNLESQWLGGFARDFQHRVICDHLSYARRRGALVSRCSGQRHAGWNVNLQTLHVNVRYVSRAHQKIQVMSADNEFLCGGKRWRTGRTTRSEQCSTLRNASRMREDGRVKPAKGNRSVEVVLQVCNNALT